MQSCDNCKYNNDGSGICSDCQVTDDGIATRYEAKDQNISMHWLSLLFLAFAAFQQDEVKEKLGELKIEGYKEKLEEMEKELRERQNGEIPKLDGCCTPAYFPMNPFICCSEFPKFQEDCYFYEEEQDMGAHIPWCNKKGERDPKDCDKEKCPYYLSQRKIHEMALTYSGQKVIIKDGEELCPHCNRRLDIYYTGLKECYCKHCGGKIRR